MEKIPVSTKPFIRGTEPRVVVDIDRVVPVEADLTVVRVEVRVRHVGVSDQIHPVYITVATAVLLMIIKSGSSLRGDVLLIAISDFFLNSKPFDETATCDSLKFLQKNSGCYSSLT